jgi:hypothetical protein
LQLKLIYSFERFDSKKRSFIAEISSGPGKNTIIWP